MLIKKDFKLYQLNEEICDNLPYSLEFRPYSRLKQHNIAVEKKNYDLLYSDNFVYNNDYSINSFLECIFEKFNLNIPEDFTGHSLSVSDVIEVDGNGYYVDSFGFELIEDWRN